MRELTRTNRRRILAVDPTSPGFGFALLEEGERLVDWGTKEPGGSDRNRACTLAVVGLIRIYSPTELAVEDWRSEHSHRAPRVNALLELISARAAESGIEVRRIDPAILYAHFAVDARPTKYSIATMLAKRFPELAYRLPPPRKSWKSEVARMAIFDAVALAVVSLASHQRRDRLRRR